MNRLVTGLAIPALLGAMIALAGCGTDEPAEVSDHAEKTPVPAGDAAHREMSETEMVDRAVQIAKAIEQAPDQAEDILAQHGMTRETFEDLLYDIAEDPNAAAAYAHAMTTP